MRISDWSSDVCSSDLAEVHGHRQHVAAGVVGVVADEVDPSGREHPDLHRGVRSATSATKVDATGRGRRCASNSPTSVTRPTGTVSAVSQSYWSPRLYQQIPRTGRPRPGRRPSAAVDPMSPPRPPPTE